MIWIVGLVCFGAGFLVADFLVYRRRNRSDLILRKTIVDSLRSGYQEHLFPVPYGEDLDRHAEVFGIKRQDG